MNNPERPKYNKTKSTIFNYNQLDMREVPRIPGKRGDGRTKVPEARCGRDLIALAVRIKR